MFDRSRLTLFAETGLPVPFITWNHPPAQPVAESSLGDAEEVLAIELGGEARAWPLRYIASHHVVTDVVGGRELVVTF